MYPCEPYKSFPSRLESAGPKVRTIHGYKSRKLEIYDKNYIAGGHLLLLNHHRLLPLMMHLSAALMIISCLNFELMSFKSITHNTFFGYNSQVISIIAAAYATLCCPSMPYFVIFTSLTY
jgi:hypothetical protein